MGPVISRRQQERVLGYVARAEGDRIPVIAQGTVPADAEGFFVAPRVYTDVPSTHPLWTEEIFGPVACLRRFATNEEAVRIANDSDFGLVATIVSEDATAAQAMSQGLQAGLVWVNAPQVIFPGTSWGGFKRSSIGRELGVAGLRTYQEMKQVLRTV
jgi:betaine-aldehyde dehydrogenase